MGYSLGPGRSGVFVYRRFCRFYGGFIMSVHHHSRVNALTCPVMSGDLVIAESGEKYQVLQTMGGDYWLRHVATGIDLTHPAPGGQIGIVRQIAGLANI